MARHGLSKIRAQKTRTREKRSVKARTLTAPLRENPVLGLALATLTWAACVAIIGWESIVRWIPSRDLLFALAGDGLFLFVGLLVTGLLIQMVRPDVLHHNGRLLLLCLIALLSVGTGAGTYDAARFSGLLEPAIIPFVLPMALPALLTTILVDSVVGVAVGLWCSLAMAVMADHSLTVLITGLVATLVAAQTAQKVRTRSRVARTGLTVGLCEVACVFGAVIMNWREMSVMITLNAAGSCVISGFLCAIIALLILPVFEYLFRITTDISLLELSDLGHPLLQRLAIEAPGTYHHSLVVANLAQAAADEIGANSLVARVCAYFHDIGKLIKPNFFAENIQMQNNPHDDLPPSMSTLIITSHVKEGLSLAMHHKLPDVVAHVISEHHGTSLITYFHHKARTNLRAEIEEREGAAVPSETVVDDSSFRYSGPRPTSRESAIICLADAVEAASRTLEKTAIPQIENMVDDITNARILDGQLDSAGLTLAEISRVKRSFVFTLASMLHGRVPYPKDETRDRQPPKNGKGARPEGSDTLHAMPGPRETTRAGAAMDSRLARTDG